MEDMSKDEKDREKRREITNHLVFFLDETAFLVEGCGGRGQYMNVQAEGKTRLEEQKRRKERTHECCHHYNLKSSYNIHCFH